MLRLKGIRFIHTYNVISLYINHIIACENKIIFSVMDWLIACFLSQNQLSTPFQVCEEEIRRTVFSEHCTGPCRQGVQDLQNHCTWPEACEEDFQACRRDIEAQKSLRGRLVVTVKDQNLFPHDN